MCLVVFPNIISQILLNEIIIEIKNKLVDLILMLMKYIYLKFKRFDKENVFGGDGELEEEVIFLH